MLAQILHRCAMYTIEAAAEKQNEMNPEDLISSFGGKPIENSLGDAIANSSQLKQFNPFCPNVLAQTRPVFEALRQLMSAFIAFMYVHDISILCV